MHRAWIALVALLAALAGCSISPQPEPPLVDRGQLMLTNDGMALTLTGGPGAVSPPDAVVTIISLDSPDPEMVITPNPDGSFSAAPFPVLVMMPPPEVRVFATAPDGSRTEPIDLVGAPDGTIMDAPRPLLGCLEVPAELDMGEVAADDIVLDQLRVVNNCPQPVFLDMVSSRLFADFTPTLGSRGMGVVVREEGGSRNIGVTFEPAFGEAGPREDIIFIQITGMDGMFGRRLFTVRGQVQ